jgi:hypothetical protein
MKIDLILADHHQKNRQNDNGRFAQFACHLVITNRQKSETKVFVKLLVIKCTQIDHMKDCQFVSFEKPNYGLKMTNLFLNLVSIFINLVLMLQFQIYYT